MGRGKCGTHKCLQESIVTVNIPSVLHLAPSRSAVTGACSLTTIMLAFVRRTAHIILYNNWSVWVTAAPKL